MKGRAAIMSMLLASCSLPATVWQQPAFWVGRTLYDDFEGPPYDLEDKRESPDGRWLSKYTGHGAAGTVATASGNGVFFEKPKAPIANETHAALTLSTAKYEDVDIYLRVMTREQLRQNSAPNSWEAAWVMWRYQDDWHHYYFVLKPNGIELGKKQNDIRAEEQVFLFTGYQPKLEIDKWSTWNIRMVDSHIEVWLNTGAGWKKVVDYYDNNPIAGQGSVGLYTEDAQVQFDDVYLTPIF